MIDLEWVRRLIDIIDGSNIDSIEIRRWGTRIRLSKTPPVFVRDGAGPPLPASAPAAPASGLAAPPEAPPSPASPGGASGALAAPSAGAALQEVISPMVGTFYRAPAPDAPAYVEVGSRVRKGQTLCILEAMKLMNELESEVGGTVREICVENAAPVEYGEVLFRIELDESR